MGSHKIERPISPPSKPGMALKKESKIQKKYTGSIGVNLDDPDPLPNHQHELVAPKKNKSLFTKLIPKRTRTTSEKIKIDKAHRKKFNKAKQLATDLFCISLSALDEANLETECSKYLNNIQGKNLSNSFIELTWDFYAAASIRSRYCPSADATVPQELVDYLKDMRDECMNKPASSFRTEMVAQAIDTLAGWWRLDCEGHGLQPDWIEPISMSVISIEALHAFQASCSDEVKRIQGRVPENFFSNSTKATVGFQDLFAPELLPLSKTLIELVDAHLKPLDIRTLELKMSLRGDPEWEGFMENLLTGISNWITMTTIPPQVEKSLADIFRMINAVKLAGNKDPVEINEIRNHAKQEVIYQLFVRPMIDAVARHLQVLRADSVSAKIKLAVEMATDQNFPLSERKKIESTQAIGFATGTSSGQLALLNRVLKMEQQDI